MPVDSGGKPPSPPSVVVDELRVRLAKARDAERTALADAVRYREQHRGPWSQSDSRRVATAEARAAGARAEAEAMQSDLTMRLVELRFAEDKNTRLAEREAERKEREAEREAERKERDRDRRFDRRVRIALVLGPLVAVVVSVLLNQWITSSRQVAATHAADRHAHTPTGSGNVH